MNRILELAGLTEAKNEKPKMTRETLLKAIADEAGLDDYIGTADAEKKFLAALGRAYDDGRAMGVRDVKPQTR